LFKEMTVAPRPFARGFAVAVVAVAAATPLMLIPGARAGPGTPFLIYFAPVIVAAWYGGFRAGMAATVLSLIVSWYAFLPPSRSFRIDDEASAVRLALFVAEGTLVSFLCGLLHAAQRRAAESAGEAARQQQAALDRERQYRLVEFRFQRLVEFSPQSTQLLHPDGSIRQVNRAFERLFGVTLEQLRGYNILRDPELVRLGVMPLMERAFAGEAVTIEPIPYVPDRGQYVGQTRWAGAYVYPVKDDAGRVEEVVLIHHDVTEQRLAQEEVRRSQQQLAAVIDNAPSAIFVKDVRGHYLLVNATFERMAGVSPGSMAGKTDADVFALDVASQFWDEDEQVARAREPMTFEESFVYKGEHRAFVTNKFPLRDASGNVYAVCGISTDVTALRRAEASARESEERLRSGLAAGAPAAAKPVRGADQAL
jgi:PAS domain S-box-containing protein